MKIILDIKDEKVEVLAVAVKVAKDYKDKYKSTRAISKPMTLSFSGLKFSVHHTETGTIIVK